MNIFQLSKYFYVIATQRSTGFVQNDFHDLS